jgi:hypothetical protein
MEMEMKMDISPVNVRFFKMIICEESVKLLILFCNINKQFTIFNDFLKV